VLPFLLLALAVVLCADLTTVKCGSVYVMMVQ
jgi:hypothetical protein